DLQILTADRYCFAPHGGDGAIIRVHGVQPGQLWPQGVAMSPTRGLKSLRGVALLAALFAITGCAQEEPKPLKLENTQQITATVLSIDQAKRLVALKDTDGKVLNVQVGPEVRNLDQVKVGDRVTVRYYQALGASIAKADDTAAGAVELTGGRAPEEERPAGHFGARITVPVTIDSVDTQSNIVNYHADDGLVRAIKAKTPQGQAFIKQLKKGD